MCQQKVLFGVLAVILNKGSKALELDAFNVNAVLMGIYLANYDCYVCNWCFTLKQRMQKVQKIQLLTCCNFDFVDRIKQVV